jgi:hypothetical protein
MMNNTRRTLCQSLISALGLGGISACSQPAPRVAQRTYTEEEQRRMHKFRGIGGAEWFLSTLSELNYIHIYDQDGKIVSAPSGLRGQGNIKFRIGQIPIRLKVTWRIQDPLNPIVDRGRGPASSVNREVWSGGKLTGTFEIPVANRIPDDLLDDLRRDPKGSLRVKIRLHREGVLLGWDIERRPGFDPKKRDSFGEIAYVAPGWVKTGGDFKEARFLEWLESANGTLIKAPDKRSINGVVPPELAARGIRLRNGFLFEPGWYIHPKTGQRIETDF